MAFTVSTIVPADLGLLMDLSSIIELAAEDHYGDQKATLAAIVVGFEDRLPAFEKTELAAWLQRSLSEWMAQSPAESFGLTMSQWQSVRALEELAKVSG